MQLSSYDEGFKFMVNMIQRKLYYIEYGTLRLNKEELLVNSGLYLKNVHDGLKTSDTLLQNINSYCVIKSGYQVLKKIILRPMLGKGIPKRVQYRDVSDGTLKIIEWVHGKQLLEDYPEVKVIEWEYPPNTPISHLGIIHTHGNYTIDIIYEYEQVLYVDDYQIKKMGDVVSNTNKDIIYTLVKNPKLFVLRDVKQTRLLEWPVMEFSRLSNSHLYPHLLNIHTNGVPTDGVFNFGAHYIFRGTRKVWQCIEVLNGRPKHFRLSDKHSTKPPELARSDFMDLIKSYRYVNIYTYTPI